MLPSNLTSYSDAELLRFIEDRSDPLIAELCKRLDGMRSETYVQELMDDRDDADRAWHLAEAEIANRDMRIKELQQLLRDNSIPVPA